MTLKPVLTTIPLSLHKDQPPLQVEVPHEFADYDLADELFETAATLIAREWATREPPTGEKSATADDGWLLTTCYDLLTHFIDAGHAAAFEQRLSRYERGKRGRTGRPNPFRTGLLAIFCTRDASLSESRRHSLSEVMMYAYRHHVPAIFIVGFRTQCSRAAEGGMDLAKTVDPHYADWIASRLKPRPDRERGPYPATLDAALSARTEQSKEDWERERDFFLKQYRDLRKLLEGIIAQESERESRNRLAAYEPEELEVDEI